VTRDEVVALETAFQAAVRDRDVETLDRLLAPEFTLTTGRAGAPVRTRAEYLEVTARSYVVEEFAFEALDVVGLGERAALVRSRYRQRGSMDGGDRTGVFLLTDVWAERDGRPLLVARHSSALG
jgi:hypothetical protein